MTTSLAAANVCSVTLSAASDVVIGDLRSAPGAARRKACPMSWRAVFVPASVRSALRDHSHSRSNDFAFQAASGFMFLTGEHNQVPQAVQAAELIAGVTCAAASTRRSSQPKGIPVSVAAVETLTALRGATRQVRCHGNRPYEAPWTALREMHSRPMVSSTARRVRSPRRAWTVSRNCSAMRGWRPALRDREARRHWDEYS